MATRRHHIEVTQEIINAAIPRDSAHCMIADAVREQIPNATFVSVDLQTIRWSDTKAGKRFIAFTPANAQQALVDFDRGVMVEPFGIYIQVVQTLKRKIAKKGADGKRDRHGESEPKRITNKHETEKSSGGSVHISGGKPPPTAALSNRRGRRRSYGLRSLDR